MSASLDTQSLPRRMRATWLRFARGWPTALLRQWPLLLVIACFVVGIGLVLTLHWRRGAMVMGGATGLAGLLRLVLSPERAGLLVVRSRAWDVTITGLTGVVIIILALVVPPF